MEYSNKLLLIIHWFVGLGAAAGGVSAVIDPHAPMGIPAEQALQHAPFSTFLIPGLFLLIVLGAGNIAGALFSRRYPAWRRSIGAGFGIILMLWIIIQCQMMQTVVFLHVLFFLIGALQLLISLKGFKREG